MKNNKYIVWSGCQYNVEDMRKCIRALTCYIDLRYAKCIRDRIMLC